MRIGRVGSRWLLAGVLALGVSYWLPRPQIAVAQRHGDFEKDVQLGDLTREARHTIEGEARDHKIVAIQQVRHGDHEFYRVDIEQPGADKIIRVGLDGRVFSVEEVADTGWVPPHHYLVEEEIRAGVEHPDTVVLERIPARAKFALLRLAEGGKVEALVAYRDHDHVVFQANVQDPEDSHRTLVIQVGYDGHVIGESVVGGARIEIEPPHEMRWSEIPPAVRDTIVHESENQHFDSIKVESHHGRTFFFVEFPYRHSNRMITIDNKGHVIADVIE